MEQMEYYVDYILSNAGKSPCGAKQGECAKPPKGWLGPFDIGLAGSMYWGSFPALLALQQYAEAAPSGVQFNRTTAAMVAHYVAMFELMKRDGGKGPTLCQECSGGAWQYP